MQPLISYSEWHDELCAITGIINTINMEVKSISGSGTVMYAWNELIGIVDSREKFIKESDGAKKGMGAFYAAQVRLEAVEEALGQEFARYGSSGGGSAHQINLFLSSLPGKGVISQGGSPDTRDSLLYDVSSNTVDWKPLLAMDTFKSHTLYAFAEMLKVKARMYHEGKMYLRSVVQFARRNDERTVAARQKSKGAGKCSDLGSGSPFEVNYFNMTAPEAEKHETLLHFCHEKPNSGGGGSSGGGSTSKVGAGTDSGSGGSKEKFSLGTWRHAVDQMQSFFQKQEADAYAALALLYLRIALGKHKILEPANSGSDTSANTDLVSPELANASMCLCSAARLYLFYNSDEGDSEKLRLIAPDPLLPHETLKAFFRFWATGTATGEGTDCNEETKALLCSALQVAKLRPLHRYPCEQALRWEDTLYGFLSTRPRHLTTVHRLLYCAAYYMHEFLGETEMAAAFYELSALSTMNAPWVMEESLNACAKVRGRQQQQQQQLYGNPAVSGGSSFWQHDNLFTACFPDTLESLLLKPQQQQQQEQEEGDPTMAAAVRDRVRYSVHDRLLFCQSAVGCIQCATTLFVRGSSSGGGGGDTAESAERVAEAIAAPLLLWCQLGVKVLQVRYHYYGKEKGKGEGNGGAPLTVEDLMLAMHPMRGSIHSGNRYLFTREFAVEYFEYMLYFLTVQVFIYSLLFDPNVNYAHRGGGEKDGQLGEWTRAQLQERVDGIVTFLEQEMVSVLWWRETALRAAATPALASGDKTAEVGSGPRSLLNSAAYKQFKRNLAARKEGGSRNADDGKGKKEEGKEEGEGEASLPPRVESLLRLIKATKAITQYTFQHHVARASYYECVDSKEVEQEAVRRCTREELEGMMSKDFGCVCECLRELRVKDAPSVEGLVQLLRQRTLFA